MRRTGWRGAVVGWLLLVWAAGCGGRTASGPPSPAAGTPGHSLRVVATVGMIADLAGIIGGDRVAVTGLMGPGVDPHLYRPSAGDVRALEEADVIFYGGLELEGRMIQLFEKMARSGKPTFAVSEDIDRSRLRQPVELEGRYDPHIWFDVTLWQEAARTVNRRLAELDPASRDTFQAHTDAYLAELAALHAEVQEKVATLPPESRVLVTAHDAFGYLGRQYGMEVRGLQGTSTATEAGVADVQRLADEIVRRKIKAIFIESSVPQATIEAVRRAAAAQGWDVQIGGQLYSDAMGTAGTPDGTYLGMVRHNVDTIVGALR